MNKKISKLDYKLETDIGGKTTITDLNSELINIKTQKGIKYKIIKILDGEEVSFEDFAVVKKGTKLKIFLENNKVLTIEDFYLYNDIKVDFFSPDNAGSNIIIQSMKLSNITEEAELVYGSGFPSVIKDILKNEEHLVKQVTKEEKVAREENIKDNIEIDTSASVAQLSMSDSSMVLLGSVAAVGAVVGLVGGSGGSSGPKLLTSILSDSPISGVEYYVNGVYKGVTGSGGEFSYYAGDTVSFKLGSVNIGSITSEEIPSDKLVLPQDLLKLDRTDTDNQDVAKLAQFYQTLDSDGDASNGIEIKTNETGDIVKNDGTVIVTSETLTNETEIILEEETTLLEDIIETDNVTIISEEDAIEHLNETTSAQDNVILLVTDIGDKMLTAGETTTVTFTFTDMVADFTTTDIIVENGSISEPVSTDGGITWTATLTPTVSIEDTTNLIIVDKNGILNINGEAIGTDTVNSFNYEVDTLIPTIDSGVITAIDENSGVNQTVYTATADDTVTFGLIGVDVDKFSIDTTTGVVVLNENPNFEVQSSYDITITATDENGNVGTKDLTLSINNMNDLGVGNVVITGTAQEDDILTADINGISDEDGVGTFTYQWQANGVDIVGATNATITLSQNEVGSIITVNVSHIDGQSNVETFMSNPTSTVLNVNDQPTLDSVYTDTNLTEDVLTGSISLADLNGSDEDGDVLTFVPQTGSTITIDSDTSGVLTTGTVDIDESGNYTLNLPDITTMGINESATVSFTVQVTDNQGETNSVSSTSTVTLTIDGTNDTPTVSAVLSSSASEDDTNVVVDLLSNASDTDANDILDIDSVTYTEGGVATSNSGVDLPTGTTITGTNLTIDPTAYNSLSTGESTTLVASYNIIDGEGGSVAQ